MKKIPPKNSFTFLSQRGIGVIEIVVAVSIIGLTMFAIFEFAVISSASVRVSARQVEAAYLAEEGLEAVRLLRNTSWDTSIASLTNGTNYYPVLASGNWSLNTTNPGLIDNVFTRTITVQSVLRDVDDNIAETGTLDPNTKRIISTVVWLEKGSAKQVELQTYITNFLSN